MVIVPGGVSRTAGVDLRDRRQLQLFGFTGRTGERREEMRREDRRIGMSDSSNGSERGCDVAQNSKQKQSRKQEASRLFQTMQSIKQMEKCRSVAVVSNEQ